MTAGPVQPEPAVARIGPVRHRHTFDQLRRSPHRGRSGPIAVSYVEQKTWSRVEIAYAIGRPVGTAVTRNRLRRRLRAALADRGSSLPAGAYVVRAGPEAPLMGLEELKVTMGRALERATAGVTGPRPSIEPDVRVGSAP